ncbi:MAG: hypothetical protein K9I68_08400 [Bacteroidales bacterium]|nr:hypothetical protein [Bacteroidales bacterium]MCF8337694.1 hypothetical protein [Bacteroidales bacterium]
MDGRVQLPVNEFLRKRFGTKNVDTITTAGPNRILAEQAHEQVIQSLLQRIDISIGAHQSSGLAIVGHHDCAGNPVNKEEQIKHIREAIRFLKTQYPNIEIIGLWVDENWQVEEVEYHET